MIIEIDGHMAELQHDYTHSVLASLQEKKDETRSDTAKEPKKKTPAKGTHAKKKEEIR